MKYDMINTPVSRVAGVISYLTWIGWIVALIIRNDRPEYQGCEFTRRHINQAFFINILEMLGGAIAWFPLLGHPIKEIIDIAVFIFWIIGISRAARGIWKPLPIVGEIELLK